MAARTTAAVSFANRFILNVDCSPRAVANGGSWGGCVDNGGSCGVVLKLSSRFFGALAGARLFFGFRPRLLGIGKQWVGTDQVGRGISYPLLANAPTPVDGYVSPTHEPNLRRLSRTAQHVREDARGMLTPGPNCVSPTARLKREWSLLAILAEPTGVIRVLPAQPASPVSLGHVPLAKICAAFPISRIPLGDGSLL
jgi:hypothetical protein